MWILKHILAVMLLVIIVGSVSMAYGHVDFHHKETVIVGETIEFKIHDHADSYHHKAIVEYSIINGPTNLTINGTGFIIWTPTQDQTGDHEIKIWTNVSERDYTAFFTYATITVIPEKNPNPTDPKIVIEQPILNPIDDITITEGDTKQITISLSNDSADTKYSITAPNFATLSGNTITISPLAGLEHTSYEITVKATNSIGSDTETFLINIESAPTEIETEKQRTVIHAISKQSVTVGNTLSFTVNPASSSNYVLTYSLENPLENASIDSSTGAFEWIPTKDQSGEHEIKFDLGYEKDGEKYYLSRSAHITVIPIEITIEETPKQTVTAGNTVEFVVKGLINSDSPLTYSLAFSPQNASINPSTGLFTWIPTDSQTGTHNILIRVSAENALSDLQRVNITVNPKIIIEQLPILNPINDIIITEGNTEQITISLSEGSINTKYSITAPNFVTLSGDTITISPLAGLEYDSYLITVKATNGMGSDTETFLINIKTAPIEINTEKPTIATIPDQTGIVGELIEFDVIATSENPNADLYFSLSPHSPHSTTLIDDTFSWTPTADDVGSHTVIFVVQDLDNGTFSTAQTVFTITAIIPTVEYIPTQTVTAGNTVEFTVNATTLDNSSLTYSLLLSPENASINPSTGDFTWNPTHEQIGYNIPLIRITAESGESALLAVIIIVNADTENPTITITTIPDQTGIVGELIEFDVIATSENPNADFYFSISPETSISHDIEFKGNTFSWIPTTDNIGSHTLTFIVQDLNSGTFSTAPVVFTITDIIQINTEKFTIDKTPTQTVTVGNTVEFTVKTSISDDSSLTYSLKNAPENASINQSTGKFTWIPTETQTGLNKILVNVLDENKTLRATLVNIIVNADTDPKKEMIENPPIVIEGIPKQSVTVGNTVEFVVKGLSSTNSPLTYSLLYYPQNASINPDTGLFTWIPTQNQIKNHMILVNVSAEDGSHDLLKVYITVNPKS